MPILSQDSYGKSGVRLTKVTRRGDLHEFKELNVNVLLHGEFKQCYTHGDNSSIVPTDTMKNTVYAIARQHDLASIESYAKTLAAHFIQNFSHVAAAEVSVAESLWNRIDINGKPHDHAFLGGNTETRTCRAKVSRESTALQGGISGMTVLKTTRSGFVGYIKDKYTTLKETTDRIFATAVDATWNYRNRAADFNGAYDSIRTAMIKVFAEHDSLAVQQTLYAMGEAALATCAEIDEINLTMPNQHRLLVNLQPLGLDNPNEIFVPTSEPYGLIAGTIRRD